MDLLGDTGVDGRLKSNSFLRKEGASAWIGFMWLWTGISG
jgi:hypothetical protein